MHKINEDDDDCVIVDNQSEASRNKSSSRKNTSTESQGDVSLPTSEDEDEYTDTSIHDDDTPKNHLKRKKTKQNGSIENFENELNKMTNRIDSSDSDQDAMCPPPKKRLKQKKNKIVKSSDSEDDNSDGEFQSMINKVKNIGTDKKPASRLTVEDFRESDKNGKATNKDKNSKEEEIENDINMVCMCWFNVEYT